MSTNVTETRTYTGRLGFTSVVNGSGFDVKLNGTTVITASKTPLKDACLYARQQNYGSHITVDVVLPLVGGGSRTVSAPITDGLSENGPTYG